MKEYIKLCSKKEREILSLKYTKDTPIDVIKNFLGNAFVRCAYGEIEIKISDETKSLICGEYIVKDMTDGSINIYNEETFNKLYLEQNVITLGFETILFFLKNDFKVRRIQWAEDEYLWTKNINIRNNTLLSYISSLPLKKEEKGKIEILHHKDNKDVLWQPMLEDIIAYDWMVDFL